MTGHGAAFAGRREAMLTSAPAFIETLRELPPDRVRDLLADSEAAGSRIARRLVDEWADRTNRFDRPGEALFGAWAGGRLVGVCGSTSTRMPVTIASDESGTSTS